MANNPNAADNLVPFTGANDPRRKNGRPPGIKNWATIVQDLLADENFIDKVYNEKPGWWDDLPNKNGANAVAAAMTIKALKGDKQAADWLRQTGFGDKVVHDFEKGLFTEMQMKVKVVDDRDKPEQETEASA